jgi:hypothetical protein
VGVPDTTDARDLIPKRLTLKALREAAAGCRACPLWERATQTVFGEGLKRSRTMLVGEQPGDREDRAGRPFVGPARPTWRRTCWRRCTRPRCCARPTTRLAVPCATTSSPI